MPKLVFGSLTRRSGRPSIVIAILFVLTLTTPALAWQTSTYDSGGHSVYDVQLGVDSLGYAYLAFASYGDAAGGDRVEYLTNRSGSWVSKAISSPVDQDDTPLDIFVTPSGKSYILFGRGETSGAGTAPGLFLLTNVSGTWHQSRPDRPVDRAYPVYRAAIAVYNGRVEIAYENGLGLFLRTFYRPGTWLRRVSVATACLIWPSMGTARPTSSSPRGTTPVVSTT